MQTILIVDDEPDILEIIAEELSPLKCSIFLAANGVEAINILKKVKINIIISDYRMPHGDGLSILNYIKSLNDRPYFIFMSAKSDLTPEECIQAGANYFFSKPFEIEQLISIVKEVI